VYCLKEDRKELERFEMIIDDTRHIRWCQGKCEENPECSMVDIKSVVTGLWATSMEFCVLYKWQDANNWGIKDPKDGGCHKDPKWLACSHNGKTASSAEPEKPALEASPKPVEANQSPVDSSLATKDAEQLETKVPVLPGWECKKKMYCLKDDHKELKRIPLKRDDPWNPRWCQTECEENPECSMVDIKFFGAGDWADMAECVLYKWQDANNWGIKDPKEGGCHKDPKWLACSHNGKGTNALII
jgi:hypothetical protein